MSKDKRKDGPKDLAGLSEEERKFLEERFGIDLSDTSDLKELEKQRKKGVRAEMTGMFALLGQ